jgi:hypothetical protein
MQWRGAGSCKENEREEEEVVAAEEKRTWAAMWREKRKR